LGGEKKTGYAGLSISFIHCGNASHASFRYRVVAPAKYLNAIINQYPANVVVLSKPIAREKEFARIVKSDGNKLIADFCDDHFYMDEMHEIAGMADALTCPTQAMKEKLSGFGYKNIYVVPDSYEFPQKKPHCSATNLLWFGNRTNYASIKDLDIGDIRIVCNKDGCIQWSLDAMREEFATADIVVMPATAAYKSPNRTLEAIRQGCFVVAEPHPSLMDFPIWIGNLKEGIAWATKHPKLARKMTKEAQAFIAERYSPKIQENAWKMVLKALA